MGVQVDSIMEVTFLSSKAHQAVSCGEVKLLFVSYLSAIHTNRRIKCAGTHADQTTHLDTHFDGDIFNWSRDRSREPLRLTFFLSLKEPSSQHSHQPLPPSATT